MARLKDDDDYYWQTSEVADYPQSSAPSTSYPAADSSLQPVSRRQLRLPNHGDCQICSQPAHGIHFGVLSCRACSAFFRRTVALNKKYTCRKGYGNCELTKEERYLCRYCRFKKALDLGMSPQNVKNRPLSPETSEGTGKCDSLIDLSDNELNPFDHFIKELRIPSANTKKIELNSLFDINRLKQEIYARLNTLVITFSPNGLNPLQRMEYALSEYRSDQRLTNLINLEKIDFNTIMPLWEKGFLRFAKWMTHNEIFYSLPLEQKYLLFRCNAVCWRRVERMQMSLEIFGSDAVLKDKVLVLSDDYSASLFTMKMDFSPISDYSFETIRYMFKPLINRSYERVVRPFVDLSPTHTEFAYILCQLAFCCDGEDSLEFATREAMARFRMQLAGNLHEYYTQNQQTTNYAARLMKLTSCVQAIQKSHAERKKIMELTKMFDLFKIENCEDQLVVK